MLVNLFKPAWKSSSVEKRLKAISAMDNASSEKQKILNQLAADDEDVSICIAAIQKLTSAALLHEMSINHIAIQNWNYALPPMQNTLQFELKPYTTCPPINFLKYWL
jgi:hypothetical protein